MPCPCEPRHSVTFLPAIRLFQVKATREAHPSERRTSDKQSGGYMSFKGIWTRPRSAALATVLAAGLGALAMAGAEHLSSANPPASFRYASPDESASRNTFAPVVKKVLPAVVNVSSAKMVKKPGGHDAGQYGPVLPPVFRRR